MQLLISGSLRPQQTKLTRKKLVETLVIATVKNEFVTPQQTKLTRKKLKDRRGDQRGVNGSQSKFLMKFGLCPKFNPSITCKHQDHTHCNRQSRHAEQKNWTHPLKELSQLIEPVATLRTKTRERVNSAVSKEGQSEHRASAKARG
jgi:hypothetical protein